MASITKSKTGIRRILFYDVNKRRKSIHLGKCSARDAEKIRTRVESIIGAKTLGNPIGQDDATWLANEGKVIRPKFEAVGLVEPAIAPPPVKTASMAEFLKDFMTRNGASKKPATRIVWQQVINSLIESMPSGIELKGVTAGHAKNYLEKLKGSTLASTTIHKRISFARQFFQDACDWEMIERNPFARIKTQGTSLKSNVEVTREQIALILDKCNSTWKAIVGLSRFGGLRCPSETLSITWGDIDWEKGRMSIPEPKVEHHEGRGVRSCPLFPELRTILETLFQESTIDGKYPSPESFVIDKPEYRAAAMRPGGWANANLRTQLLKIMRRAGVAPWARLFHSMRASRQTELERSYPLHVVCSWLGNTEAVAKKSYLLVTDGDFQKAIQAAPVEPEKSALNPTRAGQKRREKRRCTDRASATHEHKKTAGNTGKSIVFQVFSAVQGWRRGELNPRPAILPIRPLHV